MYITINNLLSLGATCLGSQFSEFFNKRIKGPVDNVPCQNFTNIIELFDGSFFNKVLNDECDSSTEELDCQEGYMYCYENYSFVHNRPSEKNFKNEFKKRIKTFNDFYNKINEQGNYFIYSLTYNDFSLTEEEILSTLEKLKFNGKDKIIIVNGIGWDYIFKGIPDIFKKHFKCFVCNFWFDWPNSKLWLRNVVTEKNNLYIKINNLLSLGGTCLGFQIANFLNMRIKGPVDNVPCNNFSKIIELFDGSFFNKVLNKKYDEHYDNGVYVYGNYFFVHNNPLEEKTLIEFKKRVENFNDFYNKINEEGNYFTYSLNVQDFSLPEEEIISTLEKLKFNGKEKIIILSKNDEVIPKFFYENFKCLNINFWYDDINKPKWEGD